MNKLFVFLLGAAFLFVALWSNSTAIAVRNQASSATPTATTTPPPSAAIEKLELDKNVILIPCRSAEDASESAESTDPACPDDKGLIGVKTIVKNPKNRPLTYAYTVSGGRIVGKGESVVWNLKNVRPGAYTITVGINEGRGFFAKTQTATITVQNCPCPDLCACPTVSVSGAADVKAGETIEFTATVSGGSSSDILYNWSVSQGEIAEGQGTPTIKVNTTEEMSGEIVATIEIGGDGLCADCAKAASATATIKEP